MMVGANVNLVVEKPPANTGDVVLPVTNLFVEDHRGLTAVKGVSFEVRAGEIFAVAAFRATDRPSSSKRSPGCGARRRVVVLNGVELVGRTCVDVLDAGLGHVPRTDSATAW